MRDEGVHGGGGWGLDEGVGHGFCLAVVRQW
jgi:hypothetical protein